MINRDHADQARVAATIIERDHADQAALAALGWLDDRELAELDHECQVNPDLRRTRTEINDMIAAVALTAPPVEPPAGSLGLIMARLFVPQRQAPARRRSRPSFVFGRVLPWAAAAGFALVAGLTQLRSFQAKWREKSGTLGAAHSPESVAPGTAPAAATTTGDSTPNPTPADPLRETSLSRSTPSQFFSSSSHRLEARLKQDEERLRTQMARIHPADGTRESLNPGSSDLRVVEMLPPGTARSSGKSELSARVSEAIARGRPEPPASAKDDARTPETPPVVRLHGHGARTDATIEVVGDNLIPIANLNLHPDAQVVHRNFPAPERYESLGLTALDADTVYDGSGGIWHRAADEMWIGQKAPDNFSPPDSDDPFSGQIPQLRAPPPVAPKAGDQAAPGDPTAQGEPYALPVLDQDGQGTLIVQNLPPAPEGELYYLWMTDPRSSTPLMVGILPEIRSGNDQFPFEVPTQGMLPTGYLLTLEPAGGTTSPQAPSQKIILQGP